MLPHKYNATEQRDLSLKQNYIKYNIYNNVYVYNYIIITIKLLYTVYMQYKFKTTESLHSCKMKACV